MTAQRREEMAESSLVLCEGCEFRSLTNEAHFWCYDCKGGLCDECVKGHEVTKILRSHHIIPIQDHFSVKDDIVESECSQHNRKIEKFCLTHDALLCVKCIQRDHSNCEDLLEIDEAAKGVKKSTAMANLEECFSTIIENIERTCSTQEEELKSLVLQEGQVKQRIKDERAKINSHLDQLEIKLFNKVNINCTEAKENINASKSNFADIKCRISNLQDKTARLKNNASEKEIFIAMKTAGKSMLVEKSVLEEKMDSCPSYMLELQISSKFESILTDIKEIGNIKLVKKAKGNTSLFQEPLMQAQGCSIFTEDLVSRIELTNKKGFRVAVRNESFRDGVILKDGQLVFGDYANKQLIYFNERERYHTTKPLKSVPEYMAFIRDDQLVVGGMLFTNLFIVDSKNTTLKETYLKNDNSCRGLSFSDGKIYRVGENGRCIYEVYLNSNDIRRIPLVQHVQKAWKIAVHQGLIYFTAYQSDKLHCCDRQGNSIWSFSHHAIRTDRYSASVALDHHNNIFVLGSELIVISPCGRHYKVLCTSSELLDYDVSQNFPTGLFFDKNTHRLLLTFNYPIAILFNIKY